MGDAHAENVNAQKGSPENVAKLRNLKWKMNTAVLQLEIPRQHAPVGNCCVSMTYTMYKNDW